MERTSLVIDGMTCDHCVRAVTHALQELESVKVEQVEVGSAIVAYDPERVRLEQITEAIGEEGYTVQSTGGRDDRN